MRACRLPLPLLLVCCCCWVVVVVADVLDLSAQIECATGRSGVDYNDYGCWCGLGGVGSPVDGIDACCLQHDACYDTLTSIGACSPLSEYFGGYSWKCTNSTTHCASAGSTCASRLCACDAMLARCLATQTYSGKKNCNQIRAVVDLMSWLQGLTRGSASPPPSDDSLQQVAANANTDQANHSRDA